MCSTSCAIVFAEEVGGGVDKPGAEFTPSLSPVPSQSGGEKGIQEGHSDHMPCLLFRGGVLVGTRAAESTTIVACVSTSEGQAMPPPKIRCTRVRVTGRACKSEPPAWPSRSDPENSRCVRLTPLPRCKYTRARRCKWCPLCHTDNVSYACAFYETVSYRCLNSSSFVGRRMGGARDRCPVPDRRRAPLRATQNGFAFAPHLRCQVPRRTGPSPSGRRRL